MRCLHLEVSASDLGFKPSVESAGGLALEPTSRDFPSMILERGQPDTQTQLKETIPASGQCSPSPEQFFEGPLSAFSSKKLRTGSCATNERKMNSGSNEFSVRRDPPRQPAPPVQTGKSERFLTHGAGLGSCWPNGVLRALVQIVESDETFRTRRCSRLSGLCEGLIRALHDDGLRRFPVPKPQHLGCSSGRTAAILPIQGSFAGVLKTLRAGMED